MKENGKERKKFMFATKISKRHDYLSHHFKFLGIFPRIFPIMCQIISLEFFLS
jgi:hypothetical protein